MMTSVIVFISSKAKQNSPDQRSSVGWALSRNLKGHRFDYHPGTSLGCRLIPDWVCARDSQSVFLSSVCLPLSLPSFPLSKNKYIHIYTYIHKIFKSKTKQQQNPQHFELRFKNIINPEKRRVLKFI